MRVNGTPSLKRVQGNGKVEFKMIPDSGLKTSKMGLPFSELVNVGEQAFGGKWEFLWMIA